MSSLDKGLRVLGLLSKQRPVLRVGEVCRSLDIPKSSASRLLRAMAEHGVLSRETQGGSYAPGPRMLELAGLYLASNGLFELVERIIERLVAEFGFVGYICLLDRNDLLILRRRHGPYPLRLLRDVGERVPAFQTSVGRALLAYGSDERAAAILAADPLWASRREEALEELALIRRSGVASSLSTYTPGVIATAAAVRDPNSGEMLAFSVSFPAAAADAATQDRIVARVREEARHLGTMLGDRAWLARPERDEALTPLATLNRGAHHAEPA